MYRIGLPAVLLLVVGLFSGSGSALSSSAQSWAMKATIIEACTCPMFCQCYFNTEPAGHHTHHGEEHYCRFNNAFQVDEGHFGDTRLDGARFWVAGDLGSDFSEGRMDWAVLTFDPSVTPAQREGIAAILGHVYPVEWNSFSIADDAKIEWQSGTERAVARMNGGKTAEVVLKRAPTAMGAGPVVLTNLQYWGAPRNDGFILMPNEVHAYRAGDKPYESRGTNGFMITFDIRSTDVEGGAAD